MSTQESQEFDRVQIRIQQGKALPYKEREKTVEVCENALQTAESRIARDLWRDALIKSFYIAYGGI